MMKLTLLLAFSLILLACRYQSANCKKSGLKRGLFHPINDYADIPQTDYVNSYIVPDDLPYYIKPNQYPSGPSLSYYPEPISTSSWDTTPSNGTRRVLPPSVPVTPRDVRPDSITDAELMQLSESLYNKENSQLDQISVNLQGRTRSIDTNDQAPDPLLQVSTKALRSPTISRMRDLFDNYEMDTSVNEFVTPQELKEEDDFIDAVMSTNVMRLTMLFLQTKGIVSSNPRTQRDLLKTIWFTLYSRGQGILGSSGFEHVFVNEVNRGKIIGLHNWVYFNEEEQAGRLDYKGYLNKIDLGNKGKIIEARFAHNGLIKPVNTLFIGTSPELELALYTVCFELRADQKCPVSLGGKKFSIQTYSWRYNGKNLIGSAFPKL